MVMAFKKIAVSNVKLKVGGSIEGYLLSKESREIDGDEGKFTLCKIVIKDAKLGPSTLWLQSDYGHILIPGLMTRVSKEKQSVDGEEVTRTVVEQDDSDKITV
jgi:hypothetical protein